VVSRGEELEESEEVFYGHSVFQQPKEENLQIQDPLEFVTSRN
jgi:hypothetical protein